MQGNINKIIIVKVKFILTFTIINKFFRRVLRSPAPAHTKQVLKMYKLNIVLFEPQIPQNTGNIARTCAVTGAALHLVEPLGFEIDDKKLKRAGLDYWDKLDITYYKNTDDFFSRVSGNFFFFTTKGRQNHSEVSYPDDNVYIIFGREDAGIDEKILHDNIDRCVRIPMRNTLRSLNLSNSVAIAAYEVLRQWDYPDLSSEGRLTKY